jgi:hypothetical protein
MSSSSALKFHSVQAQDDAFSQLFPHRYDYIWAKHPIVGERSQWQTESRHPLSDRIIQQGHALYGVRFGAQTQYCLLDIDAGSPYHPSRDPFAIGRIAGALEPLGLVEYLVCTSSYSGGLHLYFPFANAQSSWRLANAVATLLENAGFKLVPGQLEAFPNPKPYIPDSKPSLFNAHRLPLQTGSYLLNAEFQPIWSNQQTFVQQWQFAQNRNDLDPKILKQILKQAQRHLHQVSGKAEKFINDLNAEIELGWTGGGQTNRLLGRITMRSYIFHHVLSGGQPLEGSALVEEIVEVAKALPGYRKFCGHQHEIEHRAAEWARCIQSSHYFHYGDPKGKFKAKSEELETAIDQAPSWNQQQLESARDRIRNAIADLLEKELLPSQATRRFKALLQYQIGGGSLYRHRDLWHPRFLMNDSLEDLQQLNSENSAQACTSLLPNDGGNCPSNGHSDNSTLQFLAPVGSNFSTHQDDIGDVQAQQEACEEAIQLATQSQSESINQGKVEQTQKFLDSGDSILIAEATAWEQINELQKLRSQPSQLESKPERSLLLSAIEQQMTRLDWSIEQVDLFLWQHFSETCPDLLSAIDLWHWLNWLQASNIMHFVLFILKICRKRYG